MKKYWNKLAFVAIVLFAAGAVACSDDDSELPGYYTENFGYLELFPDSNTAVALSGTNDMRGVAVAGKFTDFKVKLRWAVKNDTKFVFGADPSMIASGYTAIPESAVSFKMLDAETGEPVEGDITIPAGETAVGVRVTLDDTSFAEENTAATKYMLSAVIKSIVSSDKIKISSNRNQIDYPVEVAAYEQNLVSIALNNGASESSLTAVKSESGTPELTTTEFPDLHVKLRIAIDQPITVTLEPNEQLVGGGLLFLPADKLTFTVNGVPMADNKVVIPAGETDVTVKVTLTDPTFVSGIVDATAYAYPLVIKELAGSEEVYADPDSKRFDYKIYIPDFGDFATTAPAEGAVVEDRSAWNTYLLVTGNSAKQDATNLFDGNTGSYVYYGGSTVYAVVVDMGSAQEVTGFRVHAFSGGYNAKDVNIYTSQNGEDWLLVRTGTLPEVSPQNVSFAKPLTTQYVKYEVKSAQRYGLAMTEFYVYVK